MNSDRPTNEVEFADRVFDLYCSNDGRASHKQSQSGAIESVGLDFFLRAERTFVRAAGRRPYPIMRPGTPALRPRWVPSNAAGYTRPG